MSHLPPADVLFANFHHLISLDEWVACASVSKEWNAAAQIFKRAVAIRCVKELVPNIDLSTFTDPNRYNGITDLIRYYYAAVRLQKAASYSFEDEDEDEGNGKNTILSIPPMTQTWFMCAPIANVNEFISYNVRTLTKNIMHPIATHLYSSYLCTPAFYALVAHTLLKTPYVFQPSSTLFHCFDNTIDYPNIYKGLRTIIELTEFIMHISHVKYDSQTMTAWLCVTAHYLHYTRTLLTHGNYRYNCSAIYLARKTLNIIMNFEMPVDPLGIREDLEEVLLLATSI
jgi:hypothetical protein